MCNFCFTRLFQALVRKMSEIEATLERIKNRQGVDGYVVMDREGNVLRYMPGMPQEHAGEYGRRMSILADLARNCVRDLDPEQDLQLLRIRTKKVEMLVAPGKDTVVVIIQRWTPGSSG